MFASSFQNTTPVGMQIGEHTISEYKIKKQTGKAT
jgi:hypothetical protein